MKGPTFLAALVKGAAKGPAKAKEPVSDESEEDDEDMGSVALAGAVRRAIESGDDAALASALKDFYDAC